MSERQPLSLRDHIETRLVSTDDEGKRFATPMVRDNLLSLIFGMMESIRLRYMPGIFSEEAIQIQPTHLIFYQPSLPASGETPVPHVSGEQSAVTAGF
jgi:hypothetical protein